MNTIIEMKDILEKINSRISEAKEQISELEDGMIKKNTATEQRKEKRNENSVRDLWDNIKHISIHIIGVPEEKRERRGLRKYIKG